MFGYCFGRSIRVPVGYCSLRFILPDYYAVLVAVVTEGRQGSAFSMYRRDLCCPSVMVVESSLVIRRYFATTWERAVTARALMVSVIY